ncbi:MULTISPECIES: HrpT family type III secretion system protein [Pseudomonas fluorescens group]|uniref:HrpT family type III secretion system protein n=1 Tax=Pseudomonas fluorescens group TaxID=136843 RepID=UPI000F579A7A|nr:MULTISPECIES: HrpT family type III secretion system protein [Pseudomonas fluorescens group]AZE87449.1 type III secretion protein HrpT [Pseudomonas orientalis]AZE92844.1 type III secretion protein HrpT [Pseudomonas orientalis]AZE98197.1 type III secretion protein HrpT [Pseudomonas orientalis]MBA1427006.1 type III secretion protein [Pseudomonas orientalis]UOB24762.1 type III secretion protein [Pseudomonas orientalis]
MNHSLLAATLIGATLLVVGCTPTCKGDSCSRPQSSKDTLVVWWPPHMRAEPGPSGERSDYQTVSLER